ncbi:SiaB family protein kinase [Paraburkholderia sp. CNPSo 3272]|uniref:SiaB family protein kinase n=1 Tax=Paraburkholderia sp. CNPSo 3272 TaxID=2940931 RepID=UPI0020B76813|nr:SiaB family protein kinase [Paraburkholderia sp. CNPSo 3272]MCP3723455.1 SiaB family protein kinase [Paraburkholderia sp. CNPSo 3272]
MSAILDQNCCFFEIAQKRNLLFYHKGYFSHSIVAAMSEVVKLQLEVAGLSSSTRRRIFSSFIELSHNIVHYSCDALSEDQGQGGAIREGAMCVSAEGERHLMVCVNPIATAAVDDLREKLEPLRNMSIDEIRQAYKMSLRADTPADSKGAGLGFLTMARDASAPLEFAFHPREDDTGTTLFCLKTII